MGVLDDATVHIDDPDGPIGSDLRVDGTKALVGGRQELTLFPVGVGLKLMFGAERCPQPFNREVGHCTSAGLGNEGIP